MSAHRKDGIFGDEDGGRMQDDLRARISALVLERAPLLVGDTIAIFRFSGAEPLDQEFCTRLGEIVVQLLASSIRDGEVDPRSGFVVDLHHRTMERGLAAGPLFALAYLAERTIVDELALSDRFGATSESWPLVAQLVRRASFDLLAAYTERVRLEPTSAAIVDRLTTLHTRPMLDAVLAKQLERAGRYGFEISLILFDVDRLSAINRQHGYGVGDRILERLGILIRTYFRQHDWVARYSEDVIAVLLIGPDAEHAHELAERVRATVADRLGFTDHRDDTGVAVTVTAAVINVRVSVGDAVDPERLLADAEAAVERGKRAGRNRVERVDGYPITRTLPHSSPSA
ncbi:MAG: GGDEF domain-containing protein [Acidobacteria bacterium]|nr:GGDEF domain-containing protein [Acidobacteriota bacterium]